MFKILYFIFLNFFVSFISDIIINKFKLVKEFDLYYKNKTTIEAGIYAGIPIVIGLILTMILSFLLLGYFIPNNLISLFRYIILAFLVGYVIDDIIYKFSIFDGLLLYYNTYGSGFLGSMSFIFCIIISYFILSLTKTK